MPSTYPAHSIDMPVDMPIEMSEDMSIHMSTHMSMHVSIIASLHTCVHTCLCTCLTEERPCHKAEADRHPQLRDGMAYRAVRPEDVCTYTHAFTHVYTNDMFTHM